MKPTLRPGQRVSERARDQDESAFTPILRQAWRADASTRCVLFVDREGECIDYVSSMEPYDAKVIAAHALLLLDGLRQRREVLGAGEPHGLEVATSECLLWVQRVSDDYALVVVADPNADADMLDDVVRDACRAFRRECGIPTPTWDAESQQAQDESLSVEVRQAVGWAYAPAAITRGVARTPIVGVMGRWTEDDAQRGRQVCFRVRTAEGQELTLAHSPGSNAWHLSDS